MSQRGEFPGILPKMIMFSLLDIWNYKIDTGSMSICQKLCIPNCLIPVEWFFDKFVDLFVIGAGREASLQKLSTEKHQFIHQ